MVISNTIIRPRYAETDQMGIIYHSNYIVWFEVARSDFFKAIGYSYKKLEEENIILPVLEVNCKYLKSAKYDEEVIIKTSLRFFKGIRLGLNYVIMDKSTGDKLVEGYTIHGFVDKNLKPINIKKKNIEIYNLILQATEE